MRFRSGALLALVVGLAAFCRAADAPQKFPEWPTPAPAPVPTPPPTPAPGAVVTLSGDSLYVVQSDEDVQLLASPEGVVSITVETGPVKIRGKFADGGGKVETRTYDRKNVFVVERVAAGEVELLRVPKGKVERRVLGDGTDPIPPPKPKPDPPKPDPPKPEPVTSFRVIFCYESSAALTPAMQRVMFGEKVRSYLDAKTTPHAAGKGWRRFDKDVDATNERDPEIKALWASARPQVTVVPCVIVAVNRKAEILPFPADEAEALALFAKYAEGK